MSIFSNRSWAASEAMSAKTAAHIFPWRGGPLPDLLPGEGCPVERLQPRLAAGHNDGPKFCSSYRKEIVISPLGVSLRSVKHNAPPSQLDARSNRTKPLCSTGAGTGLSTEASRLSIHSPVKSGFGTFVPLNSRIRAAHAIMARSPRTVVRPSVSGWLPR